MSEIRNPATTGAGSLLLRARDLEHSRALELLNAAWSTPVEDDRRRLTSLGEDRFRRAVQVTIVLRALGVAVHQGQVPAIMDGGGPVDGADPASLPSSLSARAAEALAAGGAGAGGAATVPDAALLGLERGLLPVPDTAAALAALAALAQPVEGDPPRPGAVPPRPPAGPAALAQPLTEALGKAYALLLAAADVAVAADHAAADAADAGAGIAGDAGAGPRLAAGTGPRLAAAAGRLLRGVIRPLGDALGGIAGATALTWPTVAAASQTAAASQGTVSQGTVSQGTVSQGTVSQGTVDLISDRVFTLALEVTGLRAVAGAPPQVAEAAAALQDLACVLAPPDDGPDCAAGRLTRLRALQDTLPSAVTVMPDGPYLATNTGRLVDNLGRDIPLRPQMALCRCGQSTTKPSCDGTHARVGFTDGKDPDRVPDRRDTYAGQRVTVLDNRGLCAHSGFCTDRLNKVFHAAAEPFVTPSGARMDEIVRVVQDCPSGALSYAMHQRECRGEVDQPRPPQIEVSKDGPYRVTGGVPLVDAGGRDVPRNEGASWEHYSLCRCGRSQNKPFCSGMHWYVDFADPVPDPERTPSLFEWAGGFPALLRMTRIFYEKYVPDDPSVSPLFADMSPDHPERVAAWLGEVFGGPKAYSGTYGGYTRMLSQHVGKGITEEQRSHWLSLLSRAADDAGVPRDAEFRSAFISYLEWGTRLAVENSQQDSQPPPNMPMPTWDWGTAGPPGGRVSALADREEPPDEPVVLPAEGETVGFERHVKTLFRRRDRQSMRFAFDLWSYDDVATHAAAILERVRAGTMPCDMTWPAEQVDAFVRWVDTGMAP